ncbi:hypothetical protein Y032_0428g1294 [Ancylostoma ceylanicum]|uniref:SCP domain-containing protein n=1 Tax=Ancylostoma ceylanicum TaxID=53326 RepID=A0A016X0Q5_9BILA|nr:hypothetical protein Y032_0428g1294 [Ancylostoma ceylanicum]
MDDTPFLRPSCLPQPLDFNRDFKRPMEKWWKQSRSYAQPNDNRLNDVSLEDFGQMANANATKIGCSFSKKGRLTAVMCIYDRLVSFCTLSITATFSEMYSDFDSYDDGDHGFDTY